MTPTEARELLARWYGNPDPWRAYSERLTEREFYELAARRFEAIAVSIRAEADDLDYRAAQARQRAILHERRAEAAGVLADEAGVGVTC